MVALGTDGSLAEIDREIASVDAELARLGAPASEREPSRRERALAAWRARPWAVRVLLVPVLLALVYAALMLQWAFLSATTSNCAFFCPDPGYLVGMAAVLTLPSSAAFYALWRGWPWARPIVGGGLLFVGAPVLAWMSVDYLLFELDVVSGASGGMLDLLLFGPLAALAAVLGRSIVWGGARAWFEGEAELA